MIPVLSGLLFLFLATVYGVMVIHLYVSQGRHEPFAAPAALPFLESAIGVLRGKTGYLVKLNDRIRLPVFTLRVPMQRIYVVSGAHLVQAIQSKANANTFVANLLDFGILFSGMNQKAKELLRASYVNGNQFTASVHKYLLHGPTLQAASSIAVENLITRVATDFVEPQETGLLEAIKHQLTLAMTGAVYGPANPFNDPEVESNWQVFVQGVTHLVNSPAPWLTARKAIRARAYITKSFQTYYENDGHLQAYDMIPEMYNKSLAIGVAPEEAVKMEIATALAMLSSGSITAFWLLFHIFSNPAALETCRKELLSLATDTEPSPAGHTKAVDTSLIKTKCPTIMAMLNETFRYHSSVVNVKKVAHDTSLGDSYTYNLKKDALIMIPGVFMHHDTAIWGNNAKSFDHTRFLEADAQAKLSNTTSFRPFGAGATMCPGRHFSLNVILSLVAVVLLRYDVESMETAGAWVQPSTNNADMWNAMPKPDRDVSVRIRPRQDNANIDIKFVIEEKAVAADKTVAADKGADAIKAVETAKAVEADKAVGADKTVQQNVDASSTLQLAEQS